MKDQNDDQKISSPLMLLQALSHSLLEHLEQACGESLLTAEKQLRKLEKQQVKLQAKLDECQLALDAAIAEGRMKAREKRTHERAELQVLFGRLQDDHRQLLDYAEELRREIAQTLDLGRNIVQLASTGPLPEPVAAEPEVQLAAEEAMAVLETSAEPLSTDGSPVEASPAARRAPRNRRNRRRSSEG